jgi:L-amino acid N-acyltransferase YncA
MITLRPATADDAEAICTIFNQGITDRIATLDTALRTPAERRQWLAERERRHPVVVASSDGIIVGWGSLNRFNTREAYDHVVDFSIYVERDWRGKGIGAQLLNHLIELARDLGYHKMVLTALVYNTAGVALYKGAGFSPVGIYHEQGQLDGRWVDVIVMEKLL